MKLLHVAWLQMNDQVKHYVHLLNSTLTATERTLCCLLENYQTREGVRVPEALKPFMLGIEFLPFQTVPSKGKTKSKVLTAFFFQVPYEGCLYYIYICIFEAGYTTDQLKVKFEFLCPL